MRQVSKDKTKDPELRHRTPYATGFFYPGGKIYRFCLKIRGFFLLFEPEISNQAGMRGIIFRRSVKKLDKTGENPVNSPSADRGGYEIDFQRSDFRLVFQI